MRQRLRANAPDKQQRHLVRWRTACFLLAGGAGLLAHPGWAILPDDPGFLQASNLLEYQVGRDPSFEQEELTKLFDQFILDYSRGNLRLGLRVESFRDSAEQMFGKTDYDEITQKYAEWSSPELSVRIGNGYAILGRGLLFRAFELPGVVRDANFPRSRYAESRDLEGVVLEGRRGRFQVTALSGRPVEEPDAPYGAEDEFIFRRGGTVSGGRLGADLGRGIRIGASYLRNDDIDKPGTEELGATDLEIRFANLLPALPENGMDLRFFGEYASRRWRPFSDGLDARDGVPHAIYTATELAWGQWGASFETKRYHQFALKVNDPPSLVPEFSYHLLNRSSHFLLTHDEQGQQLTVQGGLPGDWIVRTNWTTAVNRSDDGAGNFSGAARYDLYFLDLESPPTRDLRGAIFGAAGQNEIEGITDHYVLGGRLEYSRPDGWGAELDVEFQQEKRRVVTPLVDERQEFDNVFVALGVSKAGVGLVAIQGEFSNDPLEKDDPFTLDVVEKDPKSWWAVIGNLQIDDNHDATLFVGERRGGTACTSGTCYEVPDFSGVELRLTSRF